MSLPASGQLSLNDIRVELGFSSQTNFSLSGATMGYYVPLNNCSVYKPNQTTPYQISEWYSYCHTCACSSFCLTYNSTSCDCTTCACTSGFTITVEWIIASEVTTARIPTSTFTCGTNSLLPTSLFGGNTYSLYPNSEVTNNNTVVSKTLFINENSPWTLSYSNLGFYSPASSGFQNVTFEYSKNGSYLGSTIEEVGTDSGVSFCNAVSGFGDFFGSPWGTLSGGDTIRFYLYIAS